MPLPTKSILLWSHYLLFVAGASALAYCIAVTIEAKGYQAWAREQLQESNSKLETIAAPSGPRQFSTHAPLPRSGIALVGRVDVPRIHLLQ